MTEITQELRDYFKQYDFDIDDFINNPEFVFKEDYSITALDQHLSEVIRLVKSLDSKNNLHKIAFAAGLLEIRSQIKKTQEQNAEIMRQNQKDLREISEKFKRIEDKLSTITKSSELIAKYLIERK